VRIPESLWLDESARCRDGFGIADAFERFHAVNAPYAARLPLPLTVANAGVRRRGLGGTASGGGGGAGDGGEPGAGAGILDVHYQSSRTVPLVLDALLPAALTKYLEVWVITGTGHHTNTRSHQRSSAKGVLFEEVHEYLSECGYEFVPAKDRAGHAGAFLVLASGMREGE